MSYERCVSIPTTLVLDQNFNGFAKQLEVHPNMAIGLLVRFYSWVTNVAYDGEIGRFFSVENIEPAVGWAGEEGLFCKALLDAKIVDEDSGKVADWAQRFPFYAGAMRRREARAAARKAAAE